MDAKKFDTIARALFARVYPVIASRIKERTGITAGNGLDIGAGGGYLSIALARITDLRMTLLDESAEMLRIAAKNIAAGGLQGRLRPVRGDVHRIPLPDGSIDLAVSRGSLFFWRDQETAFREIYRVLSPDGVAYIGGGPGNAELATRIKKEMRERGLPGPDRTGNKKRRGSIRDCEEKLRSAGVASFSTNRSAEGFWIVMRKPAAEDALEAPWQKGRRGL
jgi:SAM-dependent methyltransferase